MVDVADLRRRLEPLRGKVAGILLWGSWARGEPHARSDVDVCLVAGPGRDVGEVLSAAWQDVDAGGMPLDFRVFEELPRYLQGAVLADGVVILCDDEPALFEYLYPFRKRWLDEAHRQALTPSEARELLRQSGRGRA